MTAPLADRFRRLFAYEKDAHAQTLASLERVPDKKRQSPEYAKATGLLAHIVLARWLWLVRLGQAPPDQAPRSDEDYFPGLVAPDELRRRLAAMEAAWTAFLESLDDEAVARVFTYKSLDADRFTNTVDEVLTQLFGHSLYHRGQIASIVRALGAEPAVTDFIYWSRRPVEE